jgi:hypothetical protein
MAEPDGVELLSQAAATAPTRTSSNVVSTNLRITLPPLWNGCTVRPAVVHSRCQSRQLAVLDNPFDDFEVGDQHLVGGAATF